MLLLLWYQGRRLRLKISVSKGFIANPLIPLLICYSALAKKFQFVKKMFPHQISVTYVKKF